MQKKNVTGVGIVIAVLSAQSAVAQDRSACRAPGGSLNPIMSTHTMFAYPAIAVRLGEQGETMMSVDIGKDGVPTNVTVTRSSGALWLDDAAVGYIKIHWRWAPTAHCKPAAAQAQVTLGWHMEYPPKPDIAIGMQQRDLPAEAPLWERLEAGDTYVELTLDDGARPGVDLRTVKDGRIAYSSGFLDLDQKALALAKTMPVGLLGHSPGTETVMVRWLPLPEDRKAFENVDVYATRPIISIISA